MVCFVPRRRQTPSIKIENMRRNTSLRRIFVCSCTASTLTSQKYAAPCLARILLYFSALRWAFFLARVRLVRSRRKNTPRLVLLASCSIFRALLSIVAAGASPRPTEAAQSSIHFFPQRRLCRQFTIAEAINSRPTGQFTKTKFSIHPPRKAVGFCAVYTVRKRNFVNIAHCFF